MRLNRWLLGFVGLILVGALFVDSYSFIYRYLVVHQPLGQTLTTNPSFMGRDLYLHKGLDLQGGTELTVAICHGPGNPIGSTCRNGLDTTTGPLQGQYATAQAATIPILQQRVNGLGVSEAVVQPQGTDQILVQLPGVGIDQAVAAIGTTAKLHFAVAAAGDPPDPSLLSDPAHASDPAVKTFLGDQQGLYDPNQFGGSDYPTGYHWKIDPNLQATNVTSAGTSFDATTNSYAVTINFDGPGSDEWSKLTTAAFAQTQGTPQNRIAIFLDNQIITAPDVTGGNQSSTTQITGSFTAPQASSLAAQINAGALPADIAVVQQSEVSATLGQDTVRKSLIAGGIGLVIVILFMVGYYRFPGILASLALLAYTAIVLALYKLVPITVTLAGLAGFVLSVGMAVDANVLIFERARDELRHGRSVGVAVEAGFQRARLAIRDSNVSTGIACVVLYLFGSNVVKGFALTLGIGVLVSYFSAVTITRSLLGLMLRWRMGRNPQLYTEIHDEYETNPPKGKFDIVRSRNVFFGISILIIIPGILAIMFWGFRLGLDFAGGTRINFTASQSTTQAQVQSVVDGVAKDLRPSVEAETPTSKGYPFSVRLLPSANSLATIDKIQSALDKNFHLVRDPKTGNPDIAAENVGPSVASDLARNAIILVLVSSLFIAGYLAFAFRRQKAISPWRFSVCTFFKLLHDVFVLTGIWAIIGHFSSLGEVDSLFVTALLTSVAFSIHDTIVVFDRVRENLRTGPRFTFEQIINLSTLQTMTRSLNTALTVVFVLTALLLFGGDSIRGFVLALLIGIITGTYSSIFNASTLLVSWEEARSSNRPTGGGRDPRRVQRAA